MEETRYGLRVVVFRTLSGGQQQRVLLARALAADHTDVLVLDEPTAGMDAASEAGILEFLRDLNRTRGVTMLIVTHMLPIVLNLATSIMLLGARTVLHGTVDDVLREEGLSELYGVPVHLGIVAGQRTLVVGRRHTINQPSPARVFISRRESTPFVRRGSIEWDRSSRSRPCSRSLHSPI